MAPILLKGYLILLSIFIITQHTQAQNIEKEWSIEDCINYALENNIQIKQGEINQEISKYDVKAAKYSTLPSLNGSAGHSYNFGQTIDPFTNEFATTQVRSNQFALSSSINIFNGFQTINTIKRNQANWEVSQYELEKLKNDISLNIANLYLQILFNEELKKNADNQLEVTELQLERVKKQVTAGALPEGDLKDIEAQLATEELRQINADNQLKLSILNLQQILRIEASKEFKIKSPNLDHFKGVAELISPAVLYETAVEIMPEIKSAEFKLFSNKKSVQIAKGNYLPSLSFSASIGTGFSGNNKELIRSIILPPRPTGSFTASGEEVYAPSSIPIYETKVFREQLGDNLNRSIGFRLNIPIFNNFGTRINVQKAKLNVQLAELAIEDSKQKLRQNIESAHTDAVAALKRYKAAEKSVEALKLSFQYTQERFNVGLLDSYNFTNEKNRLNDAQSELLQAKFEYIFKSKILDFYRGEAINLKAE